MAASGAFPPSFDISLQPLYARSGTFPPLSHKLHKIGHKIPKSAIDIIPKADIIRYVSTQWQRVLRLQKMLITILNGGIYK